MSVCWKRVTVSVALIVVMAFGLAMAATLANPPTAAYADSGGYVVAQTAETTKTAKTVTTTAKKAKLTAAQKALVKHYKKTDLPKYAKWFYYSVKTTWRYKSATKAVRVYVYTRKMFSGYTYKLKVRQTTKKVNGQWKSSYRAWQYNSIHQRVIKRIAKWDKDSLGDSHEIAFHRLGQEAIDDCNYYAGGRPDLRFPKYFKA